MSNHTVIISFSSRPNGNCEQISEFICSNIDGANKYGFSQFSIKPCGSCSYECFADNLKCPHIQDMEYELLDCICHSDQVIFVVPNYCNYPCANFFIFNERSQCYFQNHPERLEAYEQVSKKFIIVSNTESTNIIEAFRQHTEAEPDALLLSPRSFHKASIAGDLMKSMEAQAAVQSFLTK